MPWQELLYARAAADSEQLSMENDELKAQVSAGAEAWVNAGAEVRVRHREMSTIGGLQGRHSRP